MVRIHLLKALASLTHFPGDGKLFLGDASECQISHNYFLVERVGTEKRKDEVPTSSSQI